MLPIAFEGVKSGASGFCGSSNTSSISIVGYRMRGNLLETGRRILRFLVCLAATEGMGYPKLARMPSTAGDDPIIILKSRPEKYPRGNFGPAGHHLEKLKKVRSTTGAEFQSFEGAMAILVFEFSSLSVYRLMWRACPVGARTNMRFDYRGSVSEVRV